MLCSPFNTSANQSGELFFSPFPDPSSFLLIPHIPSSFSRRLTCPPAARLRGSLSVFLIFRGNILENWHLVLFGLDFVPLLSESKRELQCYNKYYDYNGEQVTPSGMWDFETLNNMLQHRSVFDNIPCKKCHRELATAFYVEP